MAAIHQQHPTCEPALQVAIPPAAKGYAEVPAEWLQLLDMDNEYMRPQHADADCSCWAIRLGMFLGLISVALMLGVVWLISWWLA